jgi:ubiquinone/menaquinone biosynthesis C-methylase UbiE
MESGGQQAVMKYKAKTYYQDKAVADRYHQKRFHTFLGRFNHYLEKSFLKGTIRNLKIESALDVACGTGRLTRELVDCGIEKITGTDISEEMMDVARRYCSDGRVNVDFRKGDATQLPFEDNEIDLVISYRFLDHLPAEEKKKAITELIRVSRKYMIFTMANLNPWTNLARKLRQILNKNYYEGNLIDEDDVIRLLKENNVSILKRRLKAPFVAMELMYFCEKN